MRAVVVGAGPVGMFCGITLARRGYDVVLVDRDAGPSAAGAWQRRGVMQFHHPHFFRQIVRQSLLETLPDVWDALLRAGGVPALMAGAREDMTGLACRRSTFEQVGWTIAAQEPRLTLRTGHADRLVSERGRVTGVVVDGQHADADIVISATGRAARFADDVRPPAEGGNCGFAYVSRMYRAREGVEPPSGAPVGYLYDGYLTLVFAQDDRTLSVLLVRPSTDNDLALLRHTALFDAVVPSIPDLAAWIDPARFQPITDVLAGGGLTNTYRGQLDDRRRVPVSGLFFAGDAVSTTNPAAGRGVSLGLGQANVLMNLLSENGAAPEDVAEQFDVWCTDNIKPWYDDHVYWDATLLRRFAGEDLDADARIPSDVICAAGEVDPSIYSAAGPYLGMVALPSALDTVEERARTVLRTGWRPPYASGPTRDDVADLIRAATPHR